MIHHTVLPAELIFEGNETFSPEYVTMPFERGQVVVEPLSATTGRIVQLVSSDIQDYLNPQFQPGTIVELHPQGLA